MTALARQGELRALDHFDNIPAGHVGVMVTDRAFEPHLMPGEVAVVDTSDRDHQTGEIFAIQHDHPLYGAYLRLVQAHSRECRDESGPYLGLFWTFGMRRPPALVMSDGPVLEEGWLRYSLGRVVGYMAPKWEGRR